MVVVALARAVARPTDPSNLGRGALVSPETDSCCGPQPHGRIWNRVQREEGVWHGVTHQQG